MYLLGSAGEEAATRPQKPQLQHSQSHCMVHRVLRIQVDASSFGGSFPDPQRIFSRLLLRDRMDE